MRHTTSQSPQDRCYCCCILLLLLFYDTNSRWIRPLCESFCFLFILNEKGNRRQTLSSFDVRRQLLMRKLHRLRHRQLRHSIVVAEVSTNFLSNLIGIECACVWWNEWMAANYIDQKSIQIISKIRADTAQTFVRLFCCKCLNRREVFNLARHLPISATVLMRCIYLTVAYCVSFECISILGK